MNNTSFSFRHMLLLSSCSLQNHATSCSSLMSRHRVKNKWNRVKEQHWRWLIYALHNFVLHNVTCFQKQPSLFLKVSWISQENTCFGVSFFLKKMKLYKDLSSAWISCTSANIFFLIDWCHKRFKNTIDLLLFYEEHFYGP